MRGNNLVNSSPLKNIDKLKLIKVIQEQLSLDFEILKKAALATYEDATHEESKPENEYDTRGLEASYLAGAQGKRLAEIEEIFATYRFLKIKSFDADMPIELGALVELQQQNKTSVIFLVPKGGGLIVSYEGIQIQIVASTSPLGENLLGQYEGDTIVIENARGEISYDILTVA